MRERDNSPALSELAPFGTETRMNRSIAFADATETNCSIVVRARKGASFSLRSKENSGYTKIGRELLVGGCNASLLPAVGKAAAGFC